MGVSCSGSRSGLSTARVIQSDSGMTSGLRAERELAIELARAAGELLRGELLGPRRIAFKGSSTNLVTEMDARAEALVVDGLLGAFPDDTRLAVSGAVTLDASLLATGFPYDIRVQADNNLREYAAFAVRTRGVRRLGSAVLDLAWVAAGRFDGYWELRVEPWDVAAGGLMVEEAGGRLTALTGGPLDLDAPTVVASNGRIHDEMLAVLRQGRAS